MLSANSLRLCFVGSMVGRTPGYITTQGQVLCDLFEAAGYRSISVSARLNRYARVVEIVASLIRYQTKIDLLVLDAFSGPSFIVLDVASRIGRLLGHPIVICLRGGALPDFIAQFPRWAVRVLGRADVIVAPSEFLARAVGRFGFQAQVIPNVINLSAYRYRQRRKVAPRLLWMRSFEPIYNPLMAVRVLSRLRETMPEATLTMAGKDKGMEAQVKQFAEEKGVIDNVRFPGFLDLNAKHRECEAADLFIVTNRVDNMPVAVVEACAMGLPVVATAVGGIPDLLTHDDTGLLVADDDVEAMTAEIKRLVDEPELASRLSANGRQLALLSDWDRVLPRWEAVFAEAVRRKYKR